MTLGPIQTELRHQTFDKTHVTSPAIVEHIDKTDYVMVGVRHARNARNAMFST